VQDILDKALELHASPLFQGLDADALVSLAELAHGRALRAGEQLFAAGQETNEAYLVVRGKVRLEGDGGAVEEAGPGDCIGELPALTGRPRVMTATAIDDVRVLEIPPDVLLDTLTDHPDVVRAFAAGLSARVRAAGKR